MNFGFLGGMLFAAMLFLIFPQHAYFLGWGIVFLFMFLFVLYILVMSKIHDNVKPRADAGISLENEGGFVEVTVWDSSEYFFEEKFRNSAFYQICCWRNGDGYEMPD